MASGGIGPSFDVERSNGVPMSLADVLDVAAMAESGCVLSPDGVVTPWAVVRQEADRVAGLLRDLGVRNGDRVAVLLPKSVESLTAMHAILRAGAVAVPMDPLGVRRTLAAIVEATSPRVIIATDALAGRLRGDDDDALDTRFVIVGPSESAAGGDGSVPWETVGSSAETERIEVRPDDDAYIFFTSGSTGRPKGMVHTHRSGLAYVVAAIDAHDIDASARVAGTAPMHFDMSMLELYAVPLVGATSVIVTEADERFAASLSQRIADSEATHLYAVPSLLQQLLERGALNDRDLAAVRHVAFAGEPMGATILAGWMDRCPAAAFLNAYGPAEVNVVTSHRFPKDWDGGDVPIGRAWPRVLTRVVDEAGEQVEGDTVGELEVAADSCMRGYWRLDDETRSRITVDADGRRWYRTGDLVAERSAVLYFSGRRDNQVKVRGVRIELEAVEHVLAAEPSIAQAVVAIVQGEDGVGLRAWVVSTQDVDFDQRQLLRWCRARLAAAAVPQSVVQVDAFPLTANGKIDRVAVSAWTTFD